MKSFTSRERTGAIVIALIAIGIAMAGVIVKDCSRTPAPTPAEIRVYDSAAPEADESEADESDSGKERKNKKKKRGEKGKKHKKKSKDSESGKKRKGKSAAEKARIIPKADPLSDTIPIRRR